MQFRGGSGVPEVREWRREPAQPAPWRQWARINQPARRRVLRPWVVVCGVCLLAALVLLGGFQLAAQWLG